MPNNQSDIKIVLSAQDNASKSIGDVASKVQGAFKAISIGAGIAGAGIAAFVGSSINQFSDLGGAIQDMADRTGLATESISALKVAAEQGGSSIETVEAAIKKMQVGMTSAESASDDMKKAFKGIGMSIDDIFAKGTTPEIQFELLADAIGTVKDPALKTQLAMEAFGKAGTELIPMFEDGTFNMAKWSEEAKRLGVSFDEDAAAKAALLGDTMDTLKTSMVGVQLAVAQAVAPAVQKLAEQLTPIIEKVSAWANANPDLVTKILMVSGVVLGLLAVVTPLAAALSALMPVITGVGAVLAFLGGPITLVIVAIGLLAAAIAFMVANWDVVGPKVKEVWETITSTVTEFVDKIIGMITAFGGAVANSFKQTWDSVISAAETAFYFVIGVLDFFTTHVLGVSLPTLIAGFTTGWRYISDAVVALVTGMVTVITGLWDGLVAAMNAMFSGIVDIITFFTDPIVANWTAIWTALTSAFNSVVDTIKAPIQSLFDWISSKFEAIKSIASSIGKAVSSLAGGAVSSGKSITGTRALGGPVATGNAYLVGENGPEIFQPYTAGGIVPNNRISPVGGGVTVNVNVGRVSSDVDVREMARVVGDELMRSLKQNQLLGA